MAEVIENLLTRHLNEDGIVDVASKDDITAQLNQIGIQRGMLVLVDCDYTMLGHIIGGAQTLIDALMEQVGYDGTLVMPSFTPQYLDPACHGSERIMRENWELVRDHALPFDRKLTPPQTKDPLIHQFLRNEGVIRSYHPIYSFAAWGKYAKLICDKHPLHFGLSKDSPLGKLSDLNGYVFLAGCGYNACTMFQLARYNGNQLPIKILSAPIEQNNRMVWKDMLDLELDQGGFDVIGQVMEERKIVKNMYINAARCRFFSAREAVNIATAYFHIN